MTKYLHPLAMSIASVALCASFVIVAHAQTANGARVTGRTANAAFAGQRGLVSDGQGNVDAGAASAFTTANGSHGQRTTRVSRSADGTASAERNTSATNANTGVTFDGSTTYTKGSGVSRSASCRDANGNTVTCGSGR
jgi:hypothetical protein